MARKNKMYEKMFKQLVRECNEIEDSMKVKNIVVPDTLTIDMFKTLTTNIHVSMEKLASSEGVKVTPELRKIYSKLADSLSIIETKVSVIDRDLEDSKRFATIENFEEAVANMLIRKATLKEVAEKAKQPENAVEQPPENVTYIDTDMASENKHTATPEQIAEDKLKMNAKHGRKSSEIA